MGHSTEANGTGEPLTKCEEKVEKLEEENAQLRNAAETFGELAERLSDAQRRATGKPPATARLEGAKSLPGKSFCG